MGEDIAIESFNQGASDYVLKDRLGRLPSAIRRAVQEAEQEKANQKLQHRLKEAERLEAIGNLSTGIAHDFNNILAIILGQTSLLAAEHSDSKRSLEKTDIIAEAVQRGAKIVRELMAFARKSDDSKAIIDLNKHIDDYLKNRNGTTSSKISLSFVPEKNLPMISLNPAHLDTILAKLLENAFEATPDGGAIIISTELATLSKEDEMHLKMEGTEFVRLRISDTGHGMDAKVRQHVFEPFYTTKERGQATGLGMPVVYGLVSSYGGMVDIESKPGTGTTVNILLPASDQLPVKKAIPEKADPDLGGSETILVVEDEPYVCSFLETVLKTNGYTVFAAHDYESAFEHFRGHQDDIQLVLSDIGLPRVDGIRLCAELKVIKPNLKIVLSSGYSYKEFRTRLDRLGIDEFLPKPCNAPTLLKGIRHALHPHDPHYPDRN